MRCFLRQRLLLVLLLLLDGDLLLRLRLEELLVDLDVGDQQALHLDVVLRELLPGGLQRLLLQLGTAVHELHGCLLARLVAERGVDQRVRDLLDQVMDRAEPGDDGGRVRRRYADDQPDVHLELETVLGRHTAAGRT